MKIAISQKLCPTGLIDVKLLQEEEIKKLDLDDYIEFPMKDEFMQTISKMSNMLKLANTVIKFNHEDGTIDSVTGFTISTELPQSFQFVLLNQINEALNQFKVQMKIN